MDSHMVGYLASCDLRCMNGRSLLGAQKDRLRAKVRVTNESLPGETL